ncbi:hypothetical protein D9M68_972960 [compost metagenome]
MKCATPLDQSPPCAPEINISGNITCEQLQSSDFCDENSFTNTITWNTPSDEDGTPCRNDIITYNIYFARYELTEPTLLANVRASGLNTFTPKKLPSL